VAGAFLFLALIMGLASAVSSSNATVCVVEALIALECLYFGLRLVAMSALQISFETIGFRTKYFKRRAFDLKDIRSASEATRMFVYERVYPRLNMKSGEKVDLINFEESLSRRRLDVGSVASIVSLVNEAIRHEN